MPDLGGTGVDLVIALAFLFAGWYPAGLLWQRRRTARYVRAIGTAAERLAASGRRPEIRWVGRAAFQVVVDGRPPLRRVAIVALLSAREVLGIWLANVVRGRGDALVVRADLARPPARPVEVYRGRPGREARGRIGDAWRTRVVRDVAAVASPVADDAAEQRLARLAAELDSISIAADSPHLVIGVPAARLLREDGAAWLAAAVAEIAGLAAGERG